MPSFEIRTNCEYILFVDDAENEEEAIRIAENTPYEEWDQAWAEYEAQELTE